jgi:hypothetical protein
MRNGVTVPLPKKRPGGSDTLRNDRVAYARPRMNDGYPPTWDRDFIKKWKELVGEGSGEPIEPSGYDEFRTSPAWAVIDSAISDLVENQDLVEGTLRYWIVGYIVKQLTEAGVIGVSE